jgi:small nuclear ribonucleoprotein (snRNP)-like protein
MEGRLLYVNPKESAYLLMNRCLTSFQGVLAGFDQRSDIVLSDSKERIYSMEEGVEEVPLGLYLVKGDQMCVVSSYLYKCSY